MTSLKRSKIRLIIFKIKIYWQLFIKKPIIIFVWHQVSSKFELGYNSLLDWTSSEYFENSIKYLIKKKFVFISLENAYEILSKSEKRKHRYVVFTFDDGYATVLDTIPILEKYNIPATFFINTAYTDENAVNWTDILNLLDSSDDTTEIPSNVIENLEKLKQCQNPNKYDQSRRIAEGIYPKTYLNKRLYLTREELFSINNPLFTFGLHGHEHEHHILMSPEWCEKNIIENHRRLKDHPNFIPFFSFPFGKYTINEAVKVEKMGFKTLSCNNLFNFNNSTPLNRSEMDGKVISFSLIAKQSGESLSIKDLSITNFFRYKINEK